LEGRVAGVAEAARAHTCLISIPLLPLPCSMIRSVRSFNIPFTYAINRPTAAATQINKKMNQNFANFVVQLKASNGDVAANRILGSCCNIFHPLSSLLDNIRRCACI
jgi:hypothetical protein